MSTLSAYLREFRIAKGLSQEELAHAIGLSPRQMVRIELGQHQIKAGALLRAIEVLSIPIDQVRLIFTTPTLTEEDGRRLAQEWLSNGRADVPHVPEAVEELARELASDPARLQKWLGYGERLIDERAERGNSSGS